jgi:hypothetical protein
MAAYNIVPGQQQLQAQLQLQPQHGQLQQVQPYIQQQQQHSPLLAAGAGAAHPPVSGLSVWSWIGRYSFFCVEMAIY